MLSLICRKLTLLLALISILASTASFAQSRPSDLRDRYANDEPLSFKLGETDLFPSVRIDYLQNDNAFLQQDNVTTASDITISPAIRWVADRRLLTLRGSYIGDYNVSSEEALNFADHRLALNADAEFTSRKRFAGEVSLEFGHEPLGQNLTRGFVDANDELVVFSDFEAQGEYTYGAKGAKGNVSGGLLVQNFGYHSRNDVTSGRGFTLFEPFAEFSYRLGGDTRLLSQIRYGTFRFEDSRRDRDDLSLLAGMQFAATGKSGGEFRLGIVQSQRKLSGAENQTEFVVRGKLFWEPTSFSRFELDVRRTLDNTGSSLVSTGALIGVEDLVTLRWNHEWSSRVSHLAYLRSANITRGCPDLDDGSLTGGLELNVQINRWLSVGLNGDSTTRDIPGCPGTENADPNLDYERTRVGAHVRATL